MKLILSPKALEIFTKVQNGKKIKDVAQACSEYLSGVAYQEALEHQPSVYIPKALLPVIDFQFLDFLLSAISPDVDKEDNVFYTPEFFNNLFTHQSSVLNNQPPKEILETITGYILQPRDFYHHNPIYAPFEFTSNGVDDDNNPTEQVSSEKKSQPTASVTAITPGNNDAWREKERVKNNNDPVVIALKTFYAQLAKGPIEHQMITKLLDVNGDALEIGYELDPVICVNGLHNKMGAASVLLERDQPVNRTMFRDLIFITYDMKVNTETVTYIAEVNPTKDWSTHITDKANRNEPITSMNGQLIEDNYRVIDAAKATEEEFNTILDLKAFNQLINLNCLTLVELREFLPIHFLNNEKLLALANAPLPFFHPAVFELLFTGSTKRDMPFNMHELFLMVLELVDVQNLTFEDFNQQGLIEVFSSSFDGKESLFEINAFLDFGIAEFCPDWVKTISSHQLEHAAEMDPPLFQCMVDALIRIDYKKIDYKVIHWVLEQRQNNNPLKSQLEQLNNRIEDQHMLSMLKEKVTMQKYESEIADFLQAFHNYEKQHSQVQKSLQELLHQGLSQQQQFVDDTRKQILEKYNETAELDESIKESVKDTLQALDDGNNTAIKEFNAMFDLLSKDSADWKEKFTRVMDLLEKAADAASDNSKQSLVYNETNVTVQANVAAFQLENERQVIIQKIVSSDCAAAFFARICCFQGLMKEFNLKDWLTILGCEPCRVVLTSEKNVLLLQNEALRKALIEHAVNSKNKVEEIQKLLKWKEFVVYLSDEADWLQIIDALPECGFEFYKNSVLSFHTHFIHKEQRFNLEDIIKKRIEFNYCKSAKGNEILPVDDWDTAVAGLDASTTRTKPVTKPVTKPAAKINGDDDADPDDKLIVQQKKQQQEQPRAAEVSLYLGLTQSQPSPTIVEPPSFTSAQVVAWGDTYPEVNAYEMSENELSDIFESMNKEAQKLMSAYKIVNKAQLESGKLENAATTLSPNERSFSVYFYDSKRTAADPKIAKIGEDKDVGRFEILAATVHSMLNEKWHLEPSFFHYLLPPCPTQAPSNSVDCGFVVADVAHNMLRGLFAPIVSKALAPEFAQARKALPKYLTDPVVQFAENQAIPPVYFLRPTYMPDSLQDKNEFHQSHRLQFKQMIARLLNIRGAGLVFVPLRVDGCHWILMIVSINIDGTQPNFNLDSLELAGADDSPGFAARANAVRTRLEKFLKNGPPTKAPKKPVENSSSTKELDDEKPKPPPLVIPEYLGYGVERLPVFEKNKNGPRPKVIYLSWEPGTSQIAYQLFDGNEKEGISLKNQGLLPDVKTMFQINNEAELNNLIETNPYVHMEVVSEIAKYGHAKLNTFYYEERNFELSLTVQQQQVYTEWLDRRVGDVLKTPGTTLSQWVAHIANQYHYSLVDNARADGRSMATLIRDKAIAAIADDFRKKINQDILLAYISDKMFVQLKAGIVRSIADVIIHKHQFLPEGKTLQNFIEGVLQANPELQTLKVKLTSSSPAFDPMAYLLRILETKLLPQPKKVANDYGKSRTLFGLSDTPPRLVSPPELTFTTKQQDTTLPKDLKEVIKELISGLRSFFDTDKNKNINTPDKAKTKKKCVDLITGVEALLLNNASYNEVLLHLFKTMNVPLSDGILSSSEINNFNLHKKKNCLFALGMLVLVHKKIWTIQELQANLSAEPPAKIVIGGVQVNAKKFAEEAIKKAVDEANKPIETAMLNFV